MRPFSASEAISPAIRRARSLFFEPFHGLGRSWKLAITLLLGKCGLIFVPFFLPLFLCIPLVHNARDWQADLIGFGILLFCAVYCAVFYLCSRLQFAVFDIVLFRAQFIAATWRAYRKPAHRWIIFQILWGTAVTLMAGTPAVMVAKRFIPVMLGKPGPGAMSAESPWAFMALWVALFLGGALFFLIGVVLSDLLTPLLILEELSVRQAFTRARALIVPDPWAFVRFFLLKALLGFVGYYAYILCVEVAFFLLLLVFFLLVAIVGSLLHRVGVPWAVLSAIGFSLGALLYIAFLMFLPIALGLFFSFLEAWTLYFLAGRYPLIGEHLARTDSPPPTPFVPTHWPLAYIPPPPNWPNTSG